MGRTAHCPVADTSLPSLALGDANRGARTWHSRSR